MALSEGTLAHFENVSVYRGSTLALDRINLRIDLGEHVAIMGPNGSGKSTLLKTIYRELYPLANDDSRLTVLGRSRWEVSELRSHLGLVSNDPGIFGSRPVTGREAVLSGFFGAMGLWPHLVITPRMEERTAEILDLLDASRLADRWLSEMSSGEARRVLVARALVHDPSVLVFDEPSNNLDLFAQEDLRRIMRRLASQGVTLLLITHHLTDIIPEIDRVVFIREGHILGDGPKEAMLTPERLQELFHVELEVTERDGYYCAW